MNYKAIGASSMYYELVQREDGERDEAWVQLGKAEQPVSSSQCFFCKRGIQEGEEPVRDGGNVAHASCVRFLVGLINAGRPRELQEYAPAPNLEAVRQDVEESDRRLEQAKKAVGHFISINNLLMYK